MKSGSDYKNFTEIDIEVIDQEDKENLNFENKLLNDDNVKSNQPYTYNLRDKFKATIHKRDITLDIEPIPEIEKHVAFYDGKMNDAMKRVKKFKFF